MLWKTQQFCHKKNTHQNVHLDLQHYLQNLLWKLIDLKHNSKKGKKKKRKYGRSYNSLKSFLLLHSVCFSKNIFLKMSHFPKNVFYKIIYFIMFDSNFKWVEKQSFNFLYLAYCEIELFFKKISEKQSLKISHTFYVNHK